MSTPHHESHAELAAYVATLELSNTENVLAGGRAVQYHVGSRALRFARRQHGVADVRDIDLSLTDDEYRRLMERNDLGVQVIVHELNRNGEGSPFVGESLDIGDGLYDVWCMQWYEAAREPNGIITHDELLQNSAWQPDVGVRVLSRDYLIAQRERSIAYLESKPTLTAKEQTRLAKDRADLSVLTTKK